MALSLSGCVSDIDQHAPPNLPAVVIAEFADRGSADAISALLRSEGVHASIEPSGLLIGLSASYKVLVSKSVAHRARWILQESEFSDGELTFLATGKLSGPDED